MTTTSDHDELPPYSAVNMTDVSHDQPMESMDVDDDEGVDMHEPSHLTRGDLPFDSNGNWSFSNLDDNLGTRRMPPNSEDEEFESVQVAGSDGDRMDDFKDDEGTTMKVWGTPTEDRAGVDIPWQSTEYDDQEVAEINISPPRDQENGLKMD